VRTQTTIKIPETHNIKGTEEQCTADGAEYEEEGVKSDTLGINWQAREFSMARVFETALVIILFTGLVVAQNPWDQIWQKATKQSSSTLSTDKIAAGLTEALKVSTSRAVASTGRPDGFLKNEAIKILLPDKLRKAGTTLRLVGMGPQLDELEVGMNRAAEQATPKAKQIFLNALSQMTIADARQILKGGDTAATEYFKSKSSSALTEAFAPIVHDSLQNVGVVQQYDAVLRNPIAAGVVRSQKFDLDQYVVGKTLDGLFYTLGQEEKKIRTNPAAQTTTLLKEVFGKTDVRR